MTNGEAVNWLINISADIGKAEHSDLWHYEQALSEMREMLETAQPEHATCYLDSPCEYQNVNIAMPSAQPEIIRCKNCKYSEYDRLCGVMRCTYSGKAEIVHGEHYCSYADMRGDEQDETD